MVGTLKLNCFQVAQMQQCANFKKRLFPVRCPVWTSTCHRRNTRSSTRTLTSPDRLETFPTLRTLPPSFPQPCTSCELASENFPFRQAAEATKNDRRLNRRKYSYENAKMGCFIFVIFSMIRKTNKVLGTKRLEFKPIVKAPSLKVF